jgi:hypothetical protein
VLQVYRVIDMLVIAATALIWLRMWGTRATLPTLATILILLNFRPLTSTVTMGQIDVVLLLLLTAALWALRERRDGLAGVLIAIGTILKIYPAILLLFLLAKRRWRGVIGFGGVLLLLNLISVAVMGWQIHQIFFFDVLPRLGGTTSWVENQSISGFLVRFLYSPGEVTILRSGPLVLLGTALSAATVLGGVLLALRPAEPKSIAFALQYGVFLLLMTLASPAAWMHYQTLLVIPFATLLLHLRDRDVSLLRAGTLALSFALIAYGNQWSYYDRGSSDLLTIAGTSYKFYGMLLLAGHIGYVLFESLPLRRRATNPAQVRRPGDTPEEGFALP